ncbi:MAG: hypothetical protein WCW63_00780 [Acholeplasmataceae bacterium]
MYVTSDDVLHKLGINLVLELRKDDDPNGKVERFLDDIEDWCYTRLRVDYCLNDTLEAIMAISWKAELFKAGVIKQIQYVLRNGRVSIDSGFIRETGLLINLEPITMSRDALDKFKLAGLCNMHQECEGNIWGGI